MSHTKLALRVAAIFVVLVSLVALVRALPAKGDDELTPVTQVATTTNGLGSVSPEPSKLVIPQNLVPKPNATPKTVTKKTKPVTRAPGNCETYRSLMSTYDWPINTMMAICAAESKGGVDRVNSTDTHRKRDGTVICRGSYGLMQIGCIWPDAYGYTIADLKTAPVNLEIAYQVYKKQGLQAWSTYNDGTYKLYLV